jgi:tetratricopeptide (TPR) repeat protein
VEVGTNGRTWTAEVGETQVVYAGEPLQPEFRYWVTVTADNGISTQGKDDVGFTVLGDDEAQEVREEIARLEGQSLTEETAFKWVNIYTQHGLYADAIKVLEGQVRSGTRTLDTCGVLGDLYRWVGLDARAVERYRTALELTAGNRLEQAGLQVDLGDVNYASGKLEEAVRWYEEALASYQVLGETEQVRELQGKIDDLKQRLP